MPETSPTATETVEDSSTDSTVTTVGQPAEAATIKVLCTGPSPVCAVGGGISPRPRRVVVRGAVGWQSIAAGQPVDASVLGAPTEVRDGAYLWWNPPKSLVVGGHRETLERLRALGYIQ